MNKILAIVVSYFPDKELLQKNIRAFIEDVDMVLVWENMPQTQSPQYRVVEDNPKIAYVGVGENKGIAFALNYAWHYAVEHGYQYLLTMDQDTVWHHFHEYVGATVLNENAPKGIWGPGVISEGKELFEKTNFIITSGTLIDVGFIQTMGGYPDYLVDGIDNDICCRAISQDIPIYTINNCFIEQTCGVPEVKHFLGGTFEVHNYPPKRLYGIYRNHIISFRKYPKTERLRKDWMREWMKYRLCFVLLEKDKFRKLFAIIRGIIAGLTYKIK